MHGIIDYTAIKINIKILLVGYVGYKTQYKWDAGVHKLQINQNNSR